MAKILIEEKDLEIFSDIYRYINLMHRSSCFLGFQGVGIGSLVLTNSAKFLRSCGYTCVGTISFTKTKGLEVKLESCVELGFSVDLISLIESVVSNYYNSYTS